MTALILLAATAHADPFTPVSTVDAITVCVHFSAVAKTVDMEWEFVLDQTTIDDVVLAGGAEIEWDFEYEGVLYNGSPNNEVDVVAQLWFESSAGSTLVAQQSRHETDFDTGGFVAQGLSAWSVSAAAMGAAAPGDTIRITLAGDVSSTCDTLHEQGGASVRSAQTPELVY